MFKYGKTKQAYHMIILESFRGLCWLAFFSVLVCTLLESVLQRGAGRQEEPAWSPCPGCSRLGGECCSVVQAESCAGHGEPRAWGGREGHGAGEPVAVWRQRLPRRARSKQPGLEDVEKKDFL